MKTLKGIIIAALVVAGGLALLLMFGETNEQAARRVSNKIELDWCLHSRNPDGSYANSAVECRARFQ